MRVLLFLFCSLLSIGFLQPLAAQPCPDSAATGLLDGNSVAAAVYNNGFLFWNGSGNRYRVPKDGNASAIFNANLWIGGLVGGELRVTGSDYGPAEFQPGPLDAVDCAAYNRIYKVTLEDVRVFERGGDPTADMSEWPWEYGAPVLDGDGVADNYDLEAGDRPAVTGDQIVWWIMNDAGTHGFWGTDPLRMEVSVTGAAVSAATFNHVFPQPFLTESLDHATFYTYRLRYGGDEPLKDAYVGFYVDVDVGNAGDDYIGSDSLLGLAFAYNGDDFDDTSVGYGDRPAAVGFDFMRGMSAPADDGVDNDRDGIVDEDGERLAMTAFVNLLKGSAYFRYFGFPEHAHALMQGRQADGEPITKGENGWSGTEPTTFMYSGNPPNYWSMEDLDGAGRHEVPTDKRFLISMGPVDMQPGDEQDFVLGIVWARTGDRIESVRKVKRADELVQMMVDSGLLEPDRMWFDLLVPSPRFEPPSAWRFGLGGNHPNPFTGETTVPYQLAEDAHVRLTVHDLLGREVAILEDAERRAGSHEARFDASGMPPGMYFVRMETLAQSVSRPVVVLR